MTEPAKKTSSRDQTGMVEVQGSAEAEVSSHQPREKCRKAKVVVEVSSDQPQKGGRMAEVVKPSSDHPKKRGREALPPEEKRKRKRACDNRRYHKKEDTLREIGEMKPQLKGVVDTVEEMLKQIGNLKEENTEFVSHKEKVNSEFSALSQGLEKIKGDLELVKNDFKKVESLIQAFLQKEDDLLSKEMPWDGVFLDGEEYRSMVLGPSKHISNVVGGTSEQEILAEIKKTREHHEELKRENEKLNSRVTDIEAMIRAMIPKK